MRYRIKASQINSAYLGRFLTDNTKSISKIIKQHKDAIMIGVGLATTSGVSVEIGRMLQQKESAQTMAKTKAVIQKQDVKIKALEKEAEDARNKTEQMQQLMTAMEDYLKEQEGYEQISTIEGTTAD